MDLPLLIHGAQIRNLRSEPKSSVSCSIHSGGSPYHNHGKKEKGLVYVEEIDNHLRNSVSLKALTQTFRSVRIATKNICSSTGIFEA